ncbi:MAG TPA: hypothetical protein VF267_07700 [Gammaproteobacteria bacterium]
MKPRSPCLSKSLLVLFVVTAAPVIVLLDVFTFKPATALVQIQKVHFEKARYRYKTSIFTVIETDDGRVLKLDGRRSHRTGHYLLVTRSRLFGVMLRIADFGQPETARDEAGPKVLAGFALIAVLFGFAFVASRLHPLFGVAATVSQVVFLAMLWLYSAA